jgi:hypothetical protein
MAAASEPPTHDDLVAYLPTLKRHDVTAIALCYMSAASYVGARTARRELAPANQAAQELGSASIMFDAILEQKRMELSAVMKSARDSLELKLQQAMDSLSATLPSTPTPSVRMHATDVELVGLLEKARAALVAPFDMNDVGGNTQMRPLDRMMAMVSQWEQQAASVSTMLLEYETKSKRLHEKAAIDTAIAACSQIKELLDRN